MTISPFKILCGIGLLALFSSTISKNPSLPLLVASLGGNQAAIGMVAGVSAFTGIVFSLPAGFLSDRIGRHRMLFLSGVVFATAPFAYLLVTDIWQLGVIRFYHGLATAIFGPVAMALVADLHQQNRGAKLGWFSTATLLGRFMAPAVGGVLLSLGVVGGGFNFTSLYLVCGLAGVMTMAGIALIPGKRRTRTEKTARPHGGNWRKELGQLLSNRAIMATCGVEAAILFSYGIFETFLPIRGINQGLPPWQVGLCISSQVITIAMSKPVLGSFSDRHGRPPQIIAGAFLAALCMVLFAFASFFWQLMVVSVLLGLAISVVTSASAAYIADLSKQGSHGSAMGALGSIMDIGHTTGPIVAGVLAVSYGLTVSFISGGVVLAISALYFIWRASAHVLPQES